MRICKRNRPFKKQEPLPHKFEWIEMDIAKNREEYGLMKTDLSKQKLGRREMLFIKGIYLLLSHLPTSHTTVRAVRHTAVSCLYTLRCVASCFQPSLRDTSLLFYCRIPSYRVNRKFLFGHLTTKVSQGSSHLLLHCTIQSFPIDNPCLGYYDLC